MSLYSAIWVYVRPLYPPPSFLKTSTKKKAPPPAVTPAPPPAVLPAPLLLVDDLDEWEGVDVLLGDDDDVSARLLPLQHLLHSHLDR